MADNGKHMNWGYYTELYPDTLRTIQAQSPVVYLPWGALEWHGPHLPLGVDGILAENVTEQVVRKTGGVVLPTTWWPVTPMPHPQSLPVYSSTLVSLWNDVFTALSHAQWQLVVVISGHYSQGHELALMNAAEQAIKKLGLLVLAIPPMALVDETMLDHAGLWETSLMMAVRPDLVCIDALGNKPLTLKNSGIMGSDPRGTATASMGKQALLVAVERIANAVNHLLKEGNAAMLYALYEKRRMNFQSFLENYDQGGSLEHAYKAWWQDFLYGKEKKR